MLMYCFASLFYFIRTRTVSTPFRDSLNEEQLAIKKESTRVRANIFMQGLAISVPVTYLILLKAV